MKTSEVGCAIRALRPEFTDIEKHPFSHTPAPELFQCAPTTHIAASKRIAVTPVHLRLSPPSTSAPKADLAQTGGRGKFLFWYIG